MQSALLVLAVYYVGEFFVNWRGPIVSIFSKYIELYMLFFSTITVGVGLSILGGEF